MRRLLIADNQGKAPTQQGKQIMKKHMVLYSALTALLLTFGTSLTANAGSAAPPVFGDFVWNDLNGDGLQDFGEPGLAGVVVNVCNAPTATTIDCSVPFVSFTTTDASGNYSLPLSWSTGGFAVWVDLTTVPGGFTPTTATSLYYDNSFGALQGTTIADADFGFQAVPVPAAVWLFGSGLLGLVGVVRRNRRS